MAIESVLASIAGASGLLPTTDVVAVYDQSFSQVFQTARPLKAEVSETAMAMEHPVESGATITDYRIINPVEIKLSMILEPASYKDTYSTIKQFFVSSTLLTVQTLTGTYDNMMITQMPHEEDPNIFDTITMALTLKEVLLVEAQYGTLPPRAVAKKADASTTDTGQKNPAPSRSILKSAKDKISGS